MAVASTETINTTECTLVSLVWEVEGYDAAGRIVWKTGDAYRSAGISAADLSGIAATGTIYFPSTVKGEISSQLVSGDWVKIVRVLQMLQRMTSDNKNIGVASFRMMWVFA